MIAGAHLGLYLLELFSYPRCPVCGADGHFLHADCFERLVEGGLENDHLWFWSYDGRGGEIIRTEKSRQDLGFFYWAGFYMGELASSFGLHPPDFITYVPHHPTEMRGVFSIPFILAIGISDALGVELLHAFRKSRRTEKQKFLDRKARRENVKGAFELVIDVKHVPEIWIVDDIYTTGSTLNEVARVAKQGGVKRTILVSLAKTPSIF